MTTGNHKELRWHKLLALLVCFFLYLFMGALIFHYLETDNETQVRNKLKDAKRVVLNDSCLGEEGVEEFVESVRRAVVIGIDPSGNASNPSNWDYASAFFFSGTVVTTIGYGKSVPTTDLGRNICILYALFGIPFTGWLLATIGNFYCDTFHMILSTIENLIHTHCDFKHRRLRKSALYLVIFAISYCLMVLLPSMWFVIMENWSFDIAHYYSFITLSTIGFGDYVASVDSHHPRNQRNRWLYDIAVACWYVFGLAYLACVITAIGKKQKQTLTKVRSTVKIHLGKEDKEPPTGFGLTQIYDDKLQDDGTKDAQNMNNGEVETVVNGHHVAVHECAREHYCNMNIGYMVRDEGTQTD